VDEATRRLSLSVDDGQQHLMQAMQAVSGAGIDVDDVAVRQPTLDEVFLTLTGRAIEQSDASAHAA
jgi:ABC-2 type transport system ATP-binding protein